MVHHIDISVPDDVVKDIKKRKKLNKFNVSGFFAQSYRSAFMDDLMLIKRYNETMKKALEMKKEIKIRKTIIIEEDKKYKEMLKSNPHIELIELRFLVTVKRRVSSNSSFLEPNYKRYCNTFRFIPKDKFIKKLDEINLDDHKEIQDYEESESNPVKVIVQ